MLLLRLHEQNFNLNDQRSHPDLWGRLLYLIVPYVLLLIVSFCFYRKSIETQWSFPIYPLPSLQSQTAIYTIVVGCLGFVGIWAAVGDVWTAHDWILYAVANVLLSLYVFFYQLSSRFTLFLTTLASVALAICLQWMFIETADMAEGTPGIVIRNFVGAVGAWALIYALLTLGQFLVHTLGINKTFQAVCFFVSGVLLVAGIAYWNKTSYCHWNELIGFIAVGVLLLLFAAMNTHTNKSLDLENLLD
jgi:hypothetical protein